MRRPYGSDSHALGGELTIAAAHAAETVWGARGAHSMSLSAAVELAQGLMHTSRRWSEADVARSFGVRESMVTRKAPGLHPGAMPRRPEGVSLEAHLEERAVAWTANGYDPALYPFAAVLRQLDALRFVPTVTVVDRRAA